MRAFAPFVADGLIPVRVAIEFNYIYRLYAEAGELQAQHSGRLLHEAEGKQQLSAVGDWVAVRQQTIAENGETVVAMIDGEPTVKTLRYADGRVWLMPQNPVYEPIPAEKGTLLGKVVSVLRRL